VSELKVSGHYQRADQRFFLTINNPMTSDLPAAEPQTTVAPLKQQAQEVLAAELNKEVAAETETVEPVVEAEPVESVQDLVAKGTQALALKQYENAAEALSKAVEMQVAEVGQYAPECASTFFLYGRALLGNAILKNTVLGEKAENATKMGEDLEEAMPCKYICDTVVIHLRISCSSINSLTETWWLLQ
jgi:hypothetical protein